MNGSYAVWLDERGTYEDAAKSWRDGDAPCEWIGRTIYTGKSYGGIYYMTDDRDALPPDLVTFGEHGWAGINLDGTVMRTHGEELEALLRAAMLTEHAGTPVVVSVGLFEYETAA